MKRSMFLALGLLALVGGWIVQAPKKNETSVSQVGPEISTGAALSQEAKTLGELRIFLASARQKQVERRALARTLKDTEAQITRSQEQWLTLQEQKRQLLDQRPLIKGQVQLSESESQTLASLNQAISREQALLSSATQTLKGMNL